jgi:thiosulfate dehydrogenase [quinone] large subunit
MGDSHVRLLALVPLRLFAGWALLWAGLTRLRAHWLTEPALSKEVGGWLERGAPFPWFAPFLKSTVLPHAVLFSYLVVWGLILVGAALAVGLFTRPAALFGTAMMVAFALAQGEIPSATPAWAMAAICFTLLVANPGRVAGLDQALRGRVPRWLS